MKKRNMILAIAFVAIIISVYYYMQKPIYSFQQGVAHYSQNRPRPEYNINLIQENTTFNVYSIDYKTREFLNEKTRIYALFFMPKLNKDVPGLVLLPGGGVKKEQESELASYIAGLGYAVLTIDQRGIGQTGGSYIGIEEDYKIFLQGKEPLQHLCVYDALAAYDIIKLQKGVDKRNIAIGGESMGGRYAVIAAATDKGIKGALIISSSGFDIKNNLHENEYLLSIDPDNYISKISPNMLYMIHSNNDSVVPVASAIKTFSFAKEPKEMHIIDECSHGYCPFMKEYIKDSLEKIF